MKLEFGKYKGSDITEVPLGYLHWMNSNCDMKYRLEAQEEILRRENPDHGKTTKKAELPWLEEFYVLELTEVESQDLINAIFYTIQHIKIDDPLLIRLGELLKKLNPKK